MKNTAKDQFGRWARSGQADDEPDLVEVKTCEHCGAPFTMRDNESKCHFIERFYCSKRCAAAQSSRAQMLALCSLDEVAAALGISRESARLAEVSGLRKIREYLLHGDPENRHAVKNSFSPKKRSA